MYVIGSGPAGVSCSKALLQQGIPVKMLDAGIGLEDTRTTQLRQLKNTSPGLWNPGMLAFLKEGMSADVGGIPLKLAYGSKFPYEDPERDITINASAVGVKPSLARGGLSNVWGAAALPFHAQDMVKWPIKVEDLAPHYEAVLRFMPLVARQDDLAALFPLYTDKPEKLNVSRQAGKLLSDLEGNRERLAREHIHFGHSRLAFATSRQGFSCIYCGQCMYGCPYELPYNSAHTLQELMLNPQFQYIGGIVVDSIREVGDGVQINGHELNSGAARRFDGDRVFVGGGVLSTTKILLQSLGIADRSVMLKDSQYFLLPFIRFAGTSGTAEEQLHTLSQVFLEVLDPALSSRGIHIQVYTYNELYWTAIKQAAGPLFSLLRPFADLLVGRLLVLQGYFPSELSSQIQFRLRSNHDRTEIELSPVLNKETRRVLRQVVAKLNANCRLLKGMILRPAVRLGQPGRGYHVGGSFPMSETAGPLETDILGRPAGFRRVHAIDATVFPDIPATTITFTVMANAHRIGTRAAHL
jgi:choline dehydrogenase-like flavoprotein